MALETATYINGLVTTNPTGLDPKSQGDDHIRLLKSTIKATLPNLTGAVTADQAELNILDGATLSTAELNVLDGVTVTASDLNTVTARALKAGDTYTGTHNFTGATLNAATPTVGDSTNKVATTAFVAATAFSTALPGQTGNAGKFVTTDGANASWADAVTPTGTQTLTNKTLTAPVITENVQVISTNTTAVASRTYVLTASLTLTLPASPAAGDWVGVVNRSATTTPVIGRNGSNIMGLAEDMTLDNANASLTLVYADATRGWVWN